MPPSTLKMVVNMLTNKFKLIFSTLLLFSSFTLMTGCVALATNSGALVAKGLPRADLKEKAQDWKHVACEYDEVFPEQTEKK